VAGIYGLEAKNVPEEGAVGFRIFALDDGVSAIDHCCSPSSFLNTCSAGCSMSALGSKAKDHRETKIHPLVTQNGPSLDYAVR
jgi:hypothetical protein